MMHDGKVKGTDLMHCGMERMKSVPLTFPPCIILEISDMVYCDPIKMELFMQNRTLQTTKLPNHFKPNNECNNAHGLIKCARRIFL